MNGRIRKQVEEYAGLKLNRCADYLMDFLKELYGVDGAVVEFGVYRGATLATMALWMKLNGDNSDLIGLDTFCGYPGLEKFSDTSIEEVRALFAVLGLGHPNLLVGDFAVEGKLLPPKIKLAFLDCDLYDSYLSALNCCYPKMVKGGIIVMDEYYSLKYPGARVAADEFFSDKPEKPEIYAVDDGWERWYVRF